jgi:hypothetical protein
MWRDRSDKPVSSFNPAEETVKEVVAVTSK